ncbi:hypothetical protein DQ04_04911020 [Trypanosoma grayi]|uniref:hypothetical protein n=1 Tax=Trypanosoma grayi TaxID=71804 RepID=UPI0004F4155D|nr:hypothetical protein DQ04_04911020 [Trypanosoma grayi]KEG09633.1 hypothetical protein DQ04_04911020 [Trypanosoma grayi]
MSADGLEQYLQQWRAGKRNSPVTTTTTTRGGETVGAIPPKRRSFRPHRIVPQLYLGALKDVQDTWALHQRLLPEKMLLVVSTCDRGDRPRLEMRQLLPAATATRQQGSCRVRRLAVCSWEELEAHVGDASRKAAATVVSVAATAEWLQKAVESRSFAGNDGRGEASDDGSSAHGGVVYLKLCLPWSDEPSCLVHVHFDVAIALMRAVVDGLGRAVVCHCVAGVSRSVTLVCAFLLRCWCDARATGEMPRSSGDAVKAVVEFVREVRLCACPNAGFMQQLTEYASGLLSAETVGALCRW